MLLAVPETYPNKGTGFIDSKGTITSLQARGMDQVNIKKCHGWKMSFVSESIGPKVVAPLKREIVPKAGKRDPVQYRN